MLKYFFYSTSETQERTLRKRKKEEKCDAAENCDEAASVSFDSGDDGISETTSLKMTGAQRAKRRRTQIKSKPELYQRYECCFSSQYQCKTYKSYKSNLDLLLNLPSNKI